MTIAMYRVILFKWRCQKLVSFVRIELHNYRTKAKVSCILRTKHPQKLKTFLNRESVSATRIEIRHCQQRLYVYVLLRLIARYVNVWAVRRFTSTLVDTACAIVDVANAAYYATNVWAKRETRLSIVIHNFLSRLPE